MSMCCEYVLCTPTSSHCTPVHLVLPISTHNIKESTFSNAATPCPRPCPLWRAHARGLSLSFSAFFSLPACPLFRPPLHRSLSLARAHAHFHTCRLSLSHIHTHTPAHPHTQEEESKSYGSKGEEVQHTVTLRFHPSSPRHDTR